MTFKSLCRVLCVRFGGALNGFSECNFPAIFEIVEVSLAKLCFLSISLELKYGVSLSMTNTGQLFHDDDKLDVSAWTVTCLSMTNTGQLFHDDGNLNVSARTVTVRDCLPIIKKCYKSEV